MSSNRLWPWLAMLPAFLLCCRTLGADVTVTRRGDSPVAAYQRVELKVDLGRTYDNPFDPDEISVDAKVTDPGGKQVTVPGFWGQDFPNTFQNPAGIKAPANGEPSFRVRFCPDRAGKWSVVVTAKDRDRTIESPAITIDVAPSADRGFIRVARENRQYLQFDSGDAYFPIGLNLAWPNGENFNQYVDWFDKLRGTGGNFARVWLCHPPVRIESEQTALGRYDLRNAAYFDDLLDLAGRDGISLMLTINNHRELLDRDMWGPGQWPANPYNAANGGPAKMPIDFFTDPTARKFHERRLRYLVARYSAYTSLMCWELFNEQENTRLKNIPDDWNQQMAEYLHRIDPCDHLVSTSASLPGSVWKMDAMSITQSHLYGDGKTSDLIMPAVDAPRRNAIFNKPHLIAEAGISFAKPDSAFDPDGKGTSLHNTLWASTMSGACGATAYWWWDNYVAPKNVWHELAPVSKFAATVDWPRRNFKPVLLPAPSWTTNDPETFTDLTIKSVGGGAWGFVSDQPLEVLSSGQISGSLANYLCGPQKPEFQGRAVLEVELPRAGDMTLHIAKVSDYATLRVWVDGEVTKVFQFDASPGMPDDESTRVVPEDQNVYQAVVNQDRIVPLPAGRHTIALDNSTGDWVSLDRITFTGAKSSRHADLMTVALQDDSARQMLIWLYDATSNWQADRDGTSGRQIKDISVPVPMRSGAYVVSWWDTRAGSIIRTDQLTLTDGALLLKPPPFVRDIAVQIGPASEGER